MKRRLLKNIEEPTTEELKLKYNNLSRKYDFSLYLLYFGDNNMLSFLSGIIANIPISLLIGLINFTVTQTQIGIILVVIMFSLLIVTSFLTIFAIKLTLFVIEIRDKCNNIEYKEERSNKKLLMCFERLSITHRIIMKFFILSIISIIGFISIFILTNIIN